jgi:glycosyltransferase involved in cell wall biosynthesis
MTNPEKIRSAQFVDSYYPLVDGVILAVHNYAELMNKKSYSCVVCPRYYQPFDDSSLSYEVFRTGSVRLPITEYALPTPKLDSKIKTRLKNRYPDIFHVHSPFTEGTFASAYAKKLEIPCVATFHSKYYDDVINITGSKTLAKIVTAKIVRFYHTVDSVWTVSDGAAEVLHSYGYRGDITVVKNGTTYTMPKDPEALRKKAAETFMVPTEKKILLYVGQQRWHKNLKLVLDTFKLLCERDSDYRLLMIGDGYDAKAIRQYADSLHFPDGTVRFLGRINDRSLLSGMYLLSDLFFFPSMYDTSGLVVREAASLGVPTLLTAGSTASEAIVKDVSGFTADENKVAMFREIMRIFSTPGLLEKVGEGARKEIATTWEEIVPTVMENYAQVIEKYKFDHRT